MKNVLEVSRGEFARALKSFRLRSLSNTALLAFENGFLSIESGEQLVTMRALGEWHGRAWTNSNLLKALATAPPSEDPVAIAYSDGKLRVGSTTIGCDWELVSKVFVNKATNPSVLDLLAMDRSSPRSEVHASGLARRIREAQLKLEKDIRKAAKILVDAEVSEDDLWALAARGVRRRLSKDFEK
jgi:hypothetical protein